MKKYQQLLIVSLGLVSFICFLIYKHEYDRLRNVLEVLEVFGSPPSPEKGALRSDLLDINHNPALGAGSVNELNLGQQQQPNIYDKQAFADDTFVLRNGHGVRPPDDDPVVIDDVKGNANNVPPPPKKNKDNVIQSPIQNSGEVMDNMIDDGGGGAAGDDGVIGKFANLKAKKASGVRDSVFKDKQKKQRADVDV